MKRTLAILLLLAAASWCRCQQPLLGFTISQDSVFLPQGKEALVIYYSTTNCHQCMVDLTKKVLKWQSRKPGREVYVLTRGGDIADMRFLAGGARSFFAPGECPPIIFDKDTAIAGRYFGGNDGSIGPGLLHFSRDGGHRYYSYADMFVNKGSRRMRWPIRR